MFTDICEGRDAADFLVRRDLVEEIRQHRSVADMASGYIDGPDLQCLRVDPEVDLAPDAAFRATVLARSPFALNLSLSLDAGSARPTVEESRRRLWSGAAPDRTGFSSSGRSGWWHRCRSAGGRVCLSAWRPSPSCGRTNLSLLQACVAGQRIANEPRRLSDSLQVGRDGLLYNLQLSR